jgi:hypothetical protein
MARTSPCMFGRTAYVCRREIQAPTDWSADGRFVAFVNTGFPRFANESQGDVWLVDMTHDRKVVHLLNSSIVRSTRRILLFRQMANGWHSPRMNPDDRKSTFRRFCLQIRPQLPESVISFHEQGRRRCGGGAMERSCAISDSMAASMPFQSGYLPNPSSVLRRRSSRSARSESCDSLDSRLRCVGGRAAVRNTGCGFVSAIFSDGRAELGGASSALAAMRLSAIAAVPYCLAACNGVVFGDAGQTLPWDTMRQDCPRPRDHPRDEFPACLF